MRISDQWKCWNIPIVLNDYRTHSKQETRRNKDLGISEMERAPKIFSRPKWGCLSSALTGDSTSTPVVGCGYAGTCSDIGDSRKTGQSREDPGPLGPNQVLAEPHYFKSQPRIRARFGWDDSSVVRT